MIFALASAMFSMGEAFTCSARLAWRGAFEEFGRSDRVVTVTAASRRRVVKRCKLLCDAEAALRCREWYKTQSLWNLLR